MTNVQNTSPNQNCDRQLSERAARLSTRGAHFVVGWLKARIPLSATAKQLRTQNAENKSLNPNSDSLLSKRAGRRSKGDACSFVCWLSGAGKHIADLTLEFELVLHHLEAAPTLQYCWKDSEQEDEVVRATEEATLSIYKELPRVAMHPLPRLIAPEMPQGFSNIEVTQGGSRSEPVTPPRPSLLGWLFRKFRLAA